MQRETLAISRDPADIRPSRVRRNRLQRFIFKPVFAQRKKLILWFDPASRERKSTRKSISLTAHSRRKFRNSWVVELRKFKKNKQALEYKNVRPDYLKNIWTVINWKYANEVYDKESK